jgi:prepilin-type N-terminal cleavage/methylation domain-containing protein
MKFSRSRSQGGFTLMETVIAIGVLAVLLTSFMAVFGPAATQLRKAISVQEADRLVASLEREMTTVRPNESSDYTSGFDKAYEWIVQAPQKTKTILLYQYKGNPSKIREDGSMEPYIQPGGTAGRDYVVQPMVRQRDDTSLKDDLAALDGPIYTVKLQQLIFEDGHMKEGEAGSVVPPDKNDPNSSSGGGSGSDGYPDATIAFQAEFYIVPNSSLDYVKSGGKFDPDKLSKPIFTNNMAVRR